MYHLEDTMIMYGKYNSDTLMAFIDMVHEMQNVTMWKEKIFVSEMCYVLMYCVYIGFLLVSLRSSDPLFVKLCFSS